MAQGALFAAAQKTLLNFVKGKTVSKERVYTLAEKRELAYLLDAKAAVTSLGLTRITEVQLLEWRIAEHAKLIEELSRDDRGNLRKPKARNARKS